MSLIVTVSGSPSALSRSSALSRRIALDLGRRGLSVESIVVRDLDPADLIGGRALAPTTCDALAAVHRAVGLVVVTPIYKASYTGVLKVFLDLLPHLGLAGKAVLPIALGAAPAHALALDYALRPVLAALGARQAAGGLFIVDRSLTLEGEELRIDEDTESRLAAGLDELVASVERRSRPPT